MQSGFEYRLPVSLRRGSAIRTRRLRLDEAPWARVLIGTAGQLRTYALVLIDPPAA